MLKKFYKSVSVLLIFNIIVKTIWVFYIDRKVQLQLGNEVYGNYFALLNFSLIFTVLLDAGLGIYFTANYTNKPNNSENFKSLLNLKLKLSSLYLIISLFFAFLLHSSISGLLIFLLLSQIVSSFILLLRTQFTMHQQFSIDSIFSIADKLISTIIIGVLLYTNLFPVSFTIESFTSIQLCSSVLLLGMILFLWYKRFYVNTYSNKYTNHLKSALPYALLIFIMSLFLRLDVLLLKWIHPQGNSEAGKYAYGFRLVDAFNSFGFLFASFLFPFICKNIEDKKMIQKTIYQSTLSLLFLCSFLILIVLVFKNQITTLLYKTNDTSITLIIVYCTIAFIGCGLVHIYSSLLTAYKKIKMLITVTCIFMALNVLLNILYIPQFGALGTAIILATTQIGYGFTLLGICKYKKLI